MLIWPSYPKNRHGQKKEPRAETRQESSGQTHSKNHSTTTIEPTFNNRARFHQTILVYAAYRFVLSCILFSVYFISPTQDGITEFNNHGYFSVSLTYAGTSLILLIHGWINNSSCIVFPLGGIIIDIIAISLLTYFNTTSQNNLSILLVVVIAASSIIFKSRLSTFIAALSTLAIISEHLFSIAENTANAVNKLSDQNPLSIPIGLLGIVFFGTSLLSQGISRRLRESEELAFKQATDIEELRYLNALILQRMRTGIILISSSGEVIIRNHSAYAALDINESNPENRLAIIAPPLWQNLQDWQTNKNRKKTPINIPSTGSDLSISYSPLNNKDDSDIIIFIDDLDRVRQQAQNIKLVSLGKLAASIAHEIRNPLGAISHAAQLLSEGEQLGLSDKKLLEIIEKQSIRMNGIIENVLGLSRRAHAKPELIKLSIWLEDFIQDFQSQLQIENQGNIQFSLILEQDPEVQFDPSHLSQIITNLTENAIHYGTKKEDKKTELSLTINSDTKTELAFLDIQDKGEGIATENIEHIFEPFFTTGMTGSGLGLYLCRELCELNQARLSYIQTSKAHPISAGSINNGACFRIHFAHAKKYIVTSEFN